MFLNLFRRSVSRRFYTQTVKAPSKIDQTCELTEIAAKRIALLKKKQGKNDLKLRLTVEGGGCKGFEYVFKMTSDPPNADDFVFSNAGEQLVVDEMSLDFVKGAKVDYTKDLIRESFEVIDNPNSESSCGCGSSFEAKMKV